MNSRNYYTNKEIDFTLDDLNYDEFLLQEYFNSDENSWNKISSIYQKTYNISLEYIGQNYLAWKSSSHTFLYKGIRERILKIMPTVLSNEAKVKLGLHEFLIAIKFIVKKNELIISSDKENIYSFDGFIDSIKHELKCIKSIELPSLKFNILGEKERREILDISKYILKVKLQSIYKHVSKDIEVVSPYFKTNNFDRFEICYTTNFGKYELKLENKELGKIKFPKFELQNIKSNNKYDIYAEKYLAYELKDIHKKRNKNIVDGFLNTTDMNIFLSKYIELKESQDCEVKMNGEFNGEVGKLRIGVHYIPPKLIDIEINRNRFNTGYKVLVSGLALYWLASKDNLDILVTLWIFTIPGVFLLGFSIKKDLEEIKELQNKKKYYA